MRAAGRLLRARFCTRLRALQPGTEAQAQRRAGRWASQSSGVRTWEAIGFEFDDDFEFEFDDDFEFEFDDEDDEDDEHPEP